MRSKNKTFFWTGLTPKGEQKGEILAQSINLAKLQLRHQNIIPLMIETKSRLFLKVISKKISAFQLAIFFRQLATLLEAGIPLVQSLELIKQSHEEWQLNSLLHKIKNEIVTGKTLAHSLKNCAPYFDNQICQLIHAGEQSGKLTQVLFRIAQDKEKIYALKNKIKQALFYPFIITLVGIIVSVLMLIFVVPRFADIYASLQGQLPAFTLFILSVSSVLRNNGIWLFSLSILLFSLIKWGNKQPRYKNKWDAFLLTIPFFGLFFKKIILVRFTRALSLMLSAGLSITESLKIGAETSGHSSYVKAIENLLLHVLSGKQMNAAMQLNKLFLPLSIQMTKVGEESGTLEYMLEKIAEHYESEIDHIVSYLSDLLEPLIMVILGVLIGGLVLAMYLPIFKLGTLV